MTNLVFLALLGTISAVQINQLKPLIHPETGLAITTTGQHWYGQPPLALAQDIETKKDVGPTHIDPWVLKVSRMNVSPVAGGCRYESDGTMNRECNEHLAHHGGLAQVDPITPTCTNANKATGEDQDCSAAGQSAWNTKSTSRTGDPAKA